MCRGDGVVIEAVIFDFGNVLIGWDPEHLYRHLIPDAADRRFFLEQVCTSEWNIQQDYGRPWSEAIEAKVAEHPAFEAHIRAFRARAGEMLTGLIPEGNALLAKLHGAGVPCHGLTNWSGDTFEECRPQLGFLSCLQHVAVSGHLKMGKPHPGIYLHLLEKIGLPAEACAFIDDSPANIEAAERLGMTGILFRNDGTTEARLQATGLAF